MWGPGKEVMGAGSQQDANVCCGPRQASLVR